MRLQIDPLDGPVDEVPMIIVEAQPGETVELKLETTDADGHLWRFEGRYSTGADGVLDLGREAPVDGPYEGADPGGPFWTMEFASDDLAPVAFSAPSDSLLYRLTARSPSGSETVELIRRWQAPGVTPSKLGGEGFSGSLFSPAEPAATAVLVLPGSTGLAAMEPLAALLASHGRAALVAAFMQEKGLPQALEEIPIEVVGRAMEALRTETGASRVAILSASVGTQGALAALALGAASADCAVAIAPSSVIWQALPAGGGRPPDTAAWAKGGEPLPWLAIHGERLLPEVIKHAVLKRFSRHPRPTAMHMLAAYEPSLGKSDQVERATIPVERIACPLLIASGGDDQMWPAERMGAAIAERRQQAGVGSDDVVLNFAEAGHFVRPPITPTTVPWNDALVSGGTAAANAEAQGETWRALLEFLATHLDGAGF